ncbi:ATP-binding protein [Pararhizobium haloflavum]|uniref:ATP-binding protein n=1 Tax=Pararhizobium haloflavum TaxID=2037914 RepID=UPI000C187FC5|nr:ATP-binding protein [Pararhizobium haloflavum]
MSDERQSDLEACASEPIRVPGAIQPHGALVVLHRHRLDIVQASANAGDILGQSVAPGERLPAELDPLIQALTDWLEEPEGRFQQSCKLLGRDVVASAHETPDGVIVEFEHAPAGDAGSIQSLFPKLKAFAESISVEKSDDVAATRTAEFVRTLTGFDRVLVYRFDDSWDGHVIAESNSGKLPTYLDLRFPSKDIPAQARELYRLNRVRIIPDVSYVPVPIEPPNGPITGAPLDLSFAQLRSVSPIHLEYMRNMGTNASMSVSIIVDGELWGLVACHSADPHMVGVDGLGACDFVVQAFATQIMARERAHESALRVELGAIQRRLLAAMAHADDWLKALCENKVDLLALVSAEGAAIVVDETIAAVGQTPEDADISAVATWLETQGENELFQTDTLASVMQGAERFASSASGLMAIRISELHPHWVLWFRPETLRSVTWSGDPHEVVRETGRIHPRRSFEAWKEQLRFHATPWRDAEMGTARDLRSGIVGIVLRKAEALAQLTQELQRSNRELEAFSYSVSHDLRAPFRHIVGYSELLRDREKDLDEKSLHYIESIAESAIAAGRLVDDLLNFSHLGRAALKPSNVDMDKIVFEVQRTVMLANEDRRIDWHVEKLPSAWGDASFLRQVWHNVIENAVKYTNRNEVARIEITGSLGDGEAIYRITDDGVGFDMAYIDKLFGVFQRLQRAEDFEGTGIGLALTRRIIERHGGRIWAEGEVDKGATFSFALPNKKRGSHV